MTAQQKAVVRIIPPKNPEGFKKTVLENMKRYGKDGMTFDQYNVSSGVMDYIMWQFMPRIEKAKKMQTALREHVRFDLVIEPIYKRPSIGSDQIIGMTLKLKDRWNTLKRAKIYWTNGERMDAVFNAMLADLERHATQFAAVARMQDARRLQTRKFLKGTLGLRPKKYGYNDDAYNVGVAGIKGRIDVSYSSSNRALISSSQSLTGPASQE